MTKAIEKRRRRGVAAASGLVAAWGVAFAAPALAATTPDAVTIDCVGDMVNGHVQLVSPGDGTVTITLFGGTTAPGASFESLGTTTVVSQDDVFEIAYSFKLPQHHPVYRATAQVNGSTTQSQAIMDRTCQPPVAVPEAGVAAAVPAALAAAGGAVWWFRRRRSVSG